MKRPNRQTLLIAGAGLGLLVMLFNLLSGSGGDSVEPSPPALQQAAPSADQPAFQNGSAAPATPEFYQRVRQQLMAVTPEHQEPFVPMERAAPPADSSGNQPGSSVNPLPVPPFNPQLALVQAESSTNGSAKEPHPITAPASPTKADSSEPSNTTARLRGRIYDRVNGKLTVLFELNGTLLRATNEPDSEWRIIKVGSRQITLRNGNRTLVLEVPYAP